MCNVQWGLETLEQLYYSVHNCIGPCTTLSPTVVLSVTTAVMSGGFTVRGMGGGEG